MRRQLAKSVALLHSKPSHSRWIRTTRNKKKKYNRNFIVQCQTQNTCRLEKQWNCFWKKVHCTKVSNGKKNQFDHASYYKSSIEPLLHFNPDGYKHKLQCLKSVINKDNSKKYCTFFYFYIFKPPTTRPVKHAQNLSEIWSLSQNCTIYQVWT